jgi:hypothetical protein
VSRLWHHHLSQRIQQVQCLQGQAQSGLSVRPWKGRLTCHPLNPNGSLTRLDQCVARENS